VKVEVQVNGKVRGPVIMAPKRRAEGRSVDQCGCVALRGVGIL
jgi:hypothetical protein